MENVRLKNVREKVQSRLEREDIREMAPKAGLVAIVALAVVAAGVGFVVYRRRQRRSLVRRLQDAMPEMDEIRASLKRPLERAVKVL